MPVSLRPYALVALVVVVVGVLENALFGKDHPGTAHTVSVAFFLAAVVGIAALVVLGVVALARHLRAAKA